MKNINQIFEAQNSNFSKLLAKTVLLKRLDIIFKKMLEEDLALHCHFAKITNETLAVVVDNAAWATRLRYAIPDILKNLQTQPEFQAIKKIRYTVNLEASALNSSKNRTKKPKISLENEKHWKDALANLKKNDYNSTKI